MHNPGIAHLLHLFLEKTDFVFAVMMNTSHHYLYCNPHFKSKFYIEEDLSTQNFLSDIHPDDKESFFEVVKYCEENPNEKKQVVLRLFHRLEKKYIPIEWECYLVDEQQNQKKGILWVGVDISDRQGTLTLEDGDKVVAKSEMNDGEGVENYKKKLSNLHRRLNDVLDSMAVGVWERNLQTSELIVNERWAEIVGYTLDELKPISYQTWLQLVHPQDLILSTHLLEKHFNGQSSHYIFEARMKHKLGHWVWVLTRGKISSRTQDGKPEWITGTHLDITERKNADRIIKESQAMFRNLIEFAPNAILLINKAGKITLSNNTAEKIFGYNSQELWMQSMNLLIPERFRNKHQEYHLQFLVKPEIRSMGTGRELWAIRKNGEEFPVEIALSYFESDNQFFIITTISDISTRRNQENKLKDSEEKFRTLIDRLQIGIILQDEHAAIRLTNPKALDLLGLSEDQILGKTSFDPDWRVIHEDGTDFPGHLHPVPMAIEKKEAVLGVVMGVYHPLKSGFVWLLVDAIPQFDHHGKMLQVICTFADISERKLAEQKIIQQNMILKEIAWQQSHELRRPLANILGLIELIRNGKFEELPLEEREYLKMLNLSVEELDQIINRIVKKSNFVR